jgi:hypothetical protein
MFLEYACESVPILFPVSQLPAGYPSGFIIPVDPPGNPDLYPTRLKGFGFWPGRGPESCSETRGIPVVITTLTKVDSFESLSVTQRK